MPSLIIDGINIEVENGTSIFQACQQLGIEVPHFCYHDRLKVAGNCRMCLVQVKGAPKPVASCTQPCSDNMEVLTNSEMTHKARKGVMEMLLINHPLDCPICDQGGECDLQDQAMGYGFDRSRYQENKRAVVDKNFGPLIKTSMTRCIQCTRCVRFSDEIAGNDELGAFGRGEHMEIGTYIEKAVTSELSGNLVDVCPVGALTSKPYAFKARPWELRKTESIDVLDAVGSNIRIDARGGEVMRILPRLNEDINEEWIGDKTRYAYDGLKRQRLDKPYVRVNGKLQAVTWDKAFQTIADVLAPLKGSEIAAISGDLCAAEELIALKRLMEGLGSHNLDCRQRSETFDTTQRSGYLFNSTIAGIDSADVIVLVGTNPRVEAPIINARIRKAVRQRNVAVSVIGTAYDLAYAYEHIGDVSSVLQQIADGRHSLAEVLKNAKQPMVIVGQGALNRRDGAAVQAALARIANQYLQRDGWNGFNVLHTSTGLVTGLEVGFTPHKREARDTAGIYAGCANGDIRAVYLLNADEINIAALKQTFVIYQGHHGDRAAARADVILPGCAYTEKNGTYVNTEGRAQQARAAVYPLGEAKEDWKIIRALSDYLGAGLDYISIADVRDDLAKHSDAFKNIGHIVPAPVRDFGTPGPIDPTPFISPVNNYYMTDVISRASETMAKCVMELLPQSELKAA